MVSPNGIVSNIDRSKCWTGGVGRTQGGADGTTCSTNELPGLLSFEVGTRESEVVHSLIIISDLIPIGMFDRYESIWFDLPDRTRGRFDSCGLNPSRVSVEWSVDGVPDGLGQAAGAGRQDWNLNWNLKMKWIRHCTWWLPVLACTAEFRLIVGNRSNH